MRKALVAGNWKMNGSLSALQHFIAALELNPSVDTVLFPPAVFLSAAVEQAPVALGCGVQDVGTAMQGAHTGEISATMVRELGGRWSIVGHSERRHDQYESDEMVAAKAAAALKGGLRPLVCVGETLAERQAGSEQQVVQRQLDIVLAQVDDVALRDVVVGYEPVWAIGTGESASALQVQAMHGFIRSVVRARDSQAAEAMCIIYGGSVNADNARELFAQADVDGALVGGASLDAEAFSAIIAAAAGP